MRSANAALYLLVLTGVGMLLPIWISAQTVAASPKAPVVRPNGPFGLLQIAEVREDVRLTPNQIAKVSAILPRLDHEFEVRYGAAWQKGDGESFDTMVYIEKEFEQTGDARTVALLNPAQRGASMP